MESSREMRQLRARRLFGIVAFSAAFAYLPTLYLHLTNLWGRTYYQFVPLLLLIATGLIWFRLRGGEEQQQNRLPLRLPETALLLLALVLLVGSILLSAPWVGTLSAILATASLLLHLGGRRQIAALFPIWLLLWLVLPPPFGFDIQLVAALQSATTTQASIILDALRLDHMMSGNVLEFPDRRLMVEEACSGIHSLFALFAYSAVYVVWRGIPLARGILVVASSIFWAGALNVIRVLAIAWSMDRYGVDLSSGWHHEMLGLTVFTVALLLIASTDEFLLFLGRTLAWPATVIFHEVPVLRRVSMQFRKHQAARADRKYVVEKLSGWAAWRSPMFATLFLMIGCSQLFLLGTRKTNAAEPVTVQNVKDYLPQAIGEWSLEDFKVEVRETSSIFGNYSGIWTYKTDDDPIVASLDYPFRSWHDLRSCYRAQGWQIVESEQKSIQLFKDSEFQVVASKLTRSDGRYAYLLFTEFNQQGECIDPMISNRSATTYLTNGLKNRWRKSLTSFGVIEEIYQFQFFAVADMELSDSEHQTIQQNYEAALKDVLTKHVQEAR